MTDETTPPTSFPDAADHLTPREIAEQLADQLADQFTSHLEGEAQDLRSFALEIASDMVEAKLYGRDDLIQELRGQLEMLAESHRVRGSRAGWVMAGQLTRTAIQALSLGIRAAVA